MMNNKINYYQTFIGTIVLLVGLFIYVFDRHFIPLFPIPNVIKLVEGTPQLFGSFSNFLPSFIHVFSFSLITASIIGCGKMSYLYVCMFWGMVNLLLELGQAPWIYEWIQPMISPWNDKNLIILYLDSYLKNGVFDILDVLSILFGALMAYKVLELSQSVKRPNSLLLRK